MAPRRSYAWTVCVIHFGAQCPILCSQRAAVHGYRYRNPRWPRHIRLRDQRFQPGDRRLDPPTVNGISPNHPFLYTNGALLDLGTINGTNFANGRALNSQGQVVGDLEIDDSFSRPFLWSNGVMQELDSSEPEESGVATAINDSGVIVGQSNIRYGVTFVGNSAVPLQSLGTVPSFLPFALNNAGQMAGDCSTYGGSGYRHACRFANGVPMDLQPATEPLGVSEGMAINAAGQVCGSVRAHQNGHDEAAVWTGTTLKRLGRLSGTLDSHCYAMNNFQQEVGERMFRAVSPKIRTAPSGIL